MLAVGAFSFYTPVAPLGLCGSLELFLYTPIVPLGLRKFVFGNHRKAALHLSPRWGFVALWNCFSIHLSSRWDSGCDVCPVSGNWV